MLIRNRFFDWGILKSRSFPVPLISVGNLSLGGSGKTPLVEYLIRLLTPGFKIATLSRGYGRVSKGFVVGSKKTNIKYIGDEPMQFIKKFEQVKVAVDENRCRGVESLLEKYPEIDVILLDDSFQHRWIKPGLSILLSDYYHLYFEDHLIPTGRLREFSCGAKRADLIVISKAPKILSPITRRRIIDNIHPKPNQRIVFSYINYMKPVPLFDHLPCDIPAKLSFILLFTGVADDDLIKEHLGRFCNNLVAIKFRDHHNYTLKDVQKIKDAFGGLPTNKKIVVTTEKDTMRLKQQELMPLLKTIPVYYLPIEVDFHEPDKENFDQMILNYVKKNKRNR